jgi:hypothetical protein
MLLRTAARTRHLMRRQWRNSRKPSPSKHCGTRISRRKPLHRYLWHALDESFFPSYFFLHSPMPVLSRHKLSDPPFFFFFSHSGSIFRGWKTCCSRSTTTSVNLGIWWKDLIVVLLPRFAPPMSSWSCFPGLHLPCLTSAAALACVQVLLPRFAPPMSHQCCCACLCSHADRCSSITIHHVDESLPILFLFFV